MSFPRLLCVLIAAVLSNVALAKSHHDSPSETKAHGLRDAVILIIRHAEKPETGTGLTSAGQQRANAYVRYFKSYTIEGRPLHLDALYATADSAQSHRSRLTLDPLAKALGLPVHAQFKNKESPVLAHELETGRHGRSVLIAWHHGEIPTLLRALGANPDTLLPDGRWPDSVFDWVIQLSYDHEGRIVPGKTRRINEKLMPGDGE